MAGQTPKVQSTLVSLKALHAMYSAANNEVLAKSTEKQINEICRRQSLKPLVLEGHHSTRKCVG